MIKTMISPTQNKLSPAEPDFTRFTNDCVARVLAIFNHYLAKIPSLPLRDAMAYSVLNGGKRVRPLLTYATGVALDAAWENLDIAATAVELIHTYSLIHDDLPAMDNSDLRRGQLTCHKAFTEGMAILAGDALQTLAFQIIAQHPAPLNAENRIHMVSSLSNASGSQGMVAGQAFDIVDYRASLETLKKTYALKTGALLSASIELAIWCAPHVEERLKNQLMTFGRCLGLAFQIQDDLLEIEHTTEVIGKPQDLDKTNQKVTYPVLHGIANAKQEVEQLFEEALDAIADLQEKGQLLKMLALNVLRRQN